MAKNYNNNNTFLMGSFWGTNPLRQAPGGGGGGRRSEFSWVEMKGLVFFIAVFYFYYLGFTEGKLVWAGSLFLRLVLCAFKPFWGRDTPPPPLA